MKGGGGDVDRGILCKRRWLARVDVKGGGGLGAVRLCQKLLEQCLSAFTYIRGP